MIRVAGEQARCPIELFNQQHSHEAVRQRERGERERVDRGAFDRRGEAIGAANDEGDASAFIAPTSNTPGELLRGPRCAVLIERDDGDSQRGQEANFDRSTSAER